MSREVTSLERLALCPTPGRPPGQTSEVDVTNCSPLPRIPAHLPLRLPELTIDVRERRGTPEAGEPALLRDLPRGLKEGGPGGARERAADTDPPDAKCGELRNSREVAADQHVHGFRRDGAHHRGDLLPGADP